VSGHRFDEDEQREWEAQENARRSAGDDALSRRYRVVMQSLETLPRPSLRADFAGRVVRRIERSEEPVLAPFERVTVIVFAIAFTAAAVVAAAMTNVVPMLETDTASLRWLAVLALCVAAFAFPLRLRERGG
jgi:hypothetical protein